MTTPPEELDVKTFGESSLIESVSPLKLIGFINDVLHTLLGDPTANVEDSSASLNSHIPSAFKVCSSFASDLAPMVLFILKDCTSDLTEGKLVMHLYFASNNI